MKLHFIHTHCLITPIILITVFLSIETSFGTIDLNMFHSLGTESVVPAIENNRGKPTQNSQDVRKAPSLGNHTATNPAEICFLSSDNQSQKWTKPEVQQLLILYKAHKEKFHDPKGKKISIWKEIAK
jgi:hypothetical protein